MPDSVTEIGEGAFENCPDATLFCESENDAWTWAQDHPVNAIAAEE